MTEQSITRPEIRTARMNGSMDGGVKNGYMRGDGCSCGCGLMSLPSHLCVGVWAEGVGCR
jgi:hypothetical protein